MMVSGERQVFTLTDQMPHSHIFSYIIAWYWKAQQVTGNGESSEGGKANEAPFYFHAPLSIHPFRCASLVTLASFSDQSPVPGESEDCSFLATTTTTVILQILSIPLPSFSVRMLEFLLTRRRPPPLLPRIFLLLRLVILEFFPLVSSPAKHSLSARPKPCCDFVRLDREQPNPFYSCLKGSLEFICIFIPCTPNLKFIWQYDVPRNDSFHSFFELLIFQRIPFFASAIATTKTHQSTIY